MDPDSFRKEYLEKLQALELRYVNFKATGVTTWPWLTAKVEFFVLGNAIQTWTYYPDDRESMEGLEGYPGLIVQSVSDNLLFSLGQHSPGADFFITGLGQAVYKNTASVSKRKSTVFCLAATHIFNYSMRELMEDPRVKILKVQEEPGVTRLLRVELDWTQRKESSESGIVWLNLDADWVVDHYQFQTIPIEGTRYEHFGMVEYDHTPGDSFLFPKTVTLESANADGTIDSTRTTSWVLDSVVLGEVTAPMFTLEHFGLGNRDLIAAQNKPFPWLTIVCMLVFVFSGGYLFWKRRVA